VAQTAPFPTSSTAAEPRLDLSQPLLTALVGYAAVYWLWADGLPAFAVAGGRGVGDLSPRPGYEWQLLPLTPHTIKLTESPKDSRHGTTYQVKLTGERGQATANVLDAHETLGRRDVALLVRQLDGQLRLVGSREEPLRLLTGGQGQHPGARAGLELAFTGLTTQLAPFYPGTVAVAGAAVAAPVPTSSIRVLDGHGQLRLVVPAGYDLIIEGPFKTEVRLQVQ
jgi:hypothetical protein